MCRYVILPVKMQNSGNKRQLGISKQDIGFLTTKKEQKDRDDKDSGIALCEKAIKAWLT